MNIQDVITEIVSANTEYDSIKDLPIKQVKISARGVCNGFIYT